MASLSTATVTPARRVRGRITVPGDKSISHRYALVASLADGESTLLNYSSGADCHSTLRCLRGLGVEVNETGAAISLMGRGFGGFRSPSANLDAGNSGTTMRMLAGILAGQRFTATMVGDESLSRRPMRRVMEPLGRMGARIDATEGHPPLTVHGSPLQGIAFTPETPSAQVKSAMLFAGLYADGATSVTEPAETRDHTERAFQAFGLHADISGRTITVRGGQRATPCTLTVPGDFSSAAFWMVAAASLPGSRVEIDNVGLNPTRTALVGVLRRFGARVELYDAGVAAGEPHGLIVVEGDRTGSVEIAPSEVPGLIDELPAIAALAAHGGEVIIRGAGELRVKESDRISVLVKGFRALGINAEEQGADGLVVHGSGAPSGGVADASGDHRMAMAFAVAALSASKPSTIEGADAVAISYPTFFETLERLVA
ncbi:MAG TPA: 3-phosphoshikimate 1-carboxyvinyltransferase [Vicinamibacterales bacterium]|jgi:3-phosphoshikimate 1-carboxyvinyltransferase|nr:3-phosphoshikimate 1-carboxyvinyltransferase [Vicinamibacterales bacterium]